MSGHEEIVKILLESIPRELLLNFERHYPLALERALQIGQHANTGHRTYFVGLTRHVLLNEALMLSLDECNIPHTPLRSNSILVGKVNLASIARVHINSSKWDNSRRSKEKIKLCAPNRIVASMVQVDWLYQQNPPAIDAITVFLVTQGTGTDISPSQAYIVVPDNNMDLRNPIFSESLPAFIQRYQQTQDVVDAVRPTLKAHVSKKTDLDES